MVLFYVLTTDIYSEVTLCISLFIFRLQMTEAALALSEQKVNNLGDVLTKTKTERTELMDKQFREMKKLQEVLEFFLLYLYAKSNYFIAIWILNFDWLKILGYIFIYH